MSGKRKSGKECLQVRRQSLLRCLIELSLARLRVARASKLAATRAMRNGKTPRRGEGKKLTQVKAQFSASELILRKLVRFEVELGGELGATCASASAYPSGFIFERLVACKHSAVKVRVQLDAYHNQVHQLQQNQARRNYEPQKAAEMRIDLPFLRWFWRANSRVSNDTIFRFEAR